MDHTSYTYFIDTHAQTSRLTCCQKCTVTKPLVCHEYTNLTEPKHMDMK